MGLEQNNEQHYREVVDKFVSPTATYTMTTRDYVVRATPGALAIIITLPPVAEAKGRTYSVLAAGNTTNLLTVSVRDRDDSENWRDFVMSDVGEEIFVRSDGRKWHTLVGVTNLSSGQTRYGGFNTGHAVTDAILFRTATQDTYADGQLDLLSVFGGSNANLTSAFSAKCGRFRHNVYGILCEHETYGLVGQITARNSNFSHLHAGLMGTFESSTITGITINGAYQLTAAGVMARIGGTGCITATKPIAGFAAIYNGPALISGDAVAFAACSTTPTGWTIGLYLPTGSVYKAWECVVAAVPTTRFGSSVVATLTSGTSEGIATYFEAHSRLATADNFASGIWLNIDSAPAAGDMRGLDLGIYGSGVNMAAAMVNVLSITHIFSAANPPIYIYPIRINHDAAGPNATGLFYAVNAKAVGFTAGATATATKTGDIPVRIEGTIHYIQTFDGMT